MGGGIFLLFNIFCYLQEFNSEIDNDTGTSRYFVSSSFKIAYPFLANTGFVFILKVWKFILKLGKYISKLSKQISKLSKWRMCGCRHEEDTSKQIET